MKKKQSDRAPSEWRPIAFAGYTLIAMTFGVAGVWAAVAKLDKAVIANGFVETETNRKTVEHLEGGIVREILVKEGFTVLPYINADPVLAKRLQDAGVATVMPLGSPIGSNRGLQTRDQLRIIIEQATVPVVVDAGIGAPSHAAEAMELGADAVLVNTAIAVASDPNRMAQAFKQAVEAGRAAYEVGLGIQHKTASPTSPLTAFLNS